MNENQERWLTALESGEYPQGKSSLCLQGKYCCLGVASDLFVPKDEQKLDPTTDGVAYQGETAVAPPAVIEALGLDGSTGYIGGDEVSLASMNDNGMSFPEIAAFIRSNPSRVFPA